jgi:hypothetical protein
MIDSNPGQEFHQQEQHGSSWGLKTVNIHPTSSQLCFIALVFVFSFKNNNKKTLLSPPRTPHFQCRLDSVFSPFTCFQVTVFRMGSEGQQDVEMAILTALLKGELLGRGDSDFCLPRAA